MALVAVADHVLDRQPRRAVGGAGGLGGALEVGEQRLARVPGHRLRAVDDVVAVQRADGDEGQVAQAGAGGELQELAHDRVEALLRVADEVHLVHADRDLRHAEQPGQRGVAARLLGQPAAGVDEDHGEVGGRGARDHVARVLRVAGAVVEHEAAPRRGEVAVGDVDRDALLALGAQAVGQVREVLEAGLLVGHQRLGVEQQPADQRRLAVVDGAGGGHAQHQK